LVLASFFFLLWSKRITVQPEAWRGLKCYQLLPSKSLGHGGVVMHSLKNAVLNVLVGEKFYLCCQLARRRRLKKNYRFFFNGTWGNDSVREIFV